MVKKMVEAKKATLENNKSNIVAAQEKQTQTCDCKHCTSCEVYSAGSAVLKKDFTRKREKEESLIVIGSVHTLSLESEERSLSAGVIQ